VSLALDYQKIRLPFERHGTAVPLQVESVFVGGMPIAVLDRAQSAQLMIDLALARGRRLPAVITSANGQVISMCARDPQLRKLFLSTDLIHADGMPLIFASRLRRRTPLPERVATTDLFHDVARLAESRGASFYLLGASADVIEKAVENVRQTYPQLTIAGYRNGYFKDHEAEQVVASINQTRPDILWIGMGVPAEQMFSLRHREGLRNVGVIKTSGGLFDFVAGKNSRAPLWMQSAGLEWLYRLAIEPRRLLSRYLLTNPHALYLLLTNPSYVVADKQELTWS
jgi:N-acetylglucosaminyldiphosphoundecaprenol N-acetyl-beta-D-mannosaminyltransferase